MRNYLLARGLWELTQGTANAPESKQELDFFNRRFYQTNSILVGSCSRDITLSLEWSTDPHATWNYLENQYQPLCNRLCLEPGFRLGPEAHNGA